MPAVAIVVSSIGASLGTAAFAGTALAAYGGMIGAGIAGGMMSMSQGGDFGKGFLMGAVGNFVGGQIGGMFGGAEGLSESAFQAADYANLAGQGLDAAAIGQNMGAAAGNWGGVLGDMSSAISSGMGEITIPNSEVAANFGTSPDGSMPVSYEEGMGVGLNGDYYKPQTVEGTMEPWSLGGEQGNGVTTYPFDEAVNNPLATTPTQTPPTLQDIVSTPTNSYDPMGGDSSLNYGGYEPGSLENVTAQSGGNTAGSFGTPTQSSFIDRMKGWVSDSDAKLAQFGMPKGSSVMGLAGIGQYMMGNYETYKAEQIAKGMRPLTLEEFQNKMYNSNDYKQAANSMAKSGRTGTLPTLLARMKQQSSMDYTKNYQPTANENWWNVNANISRQRTNNLGNLTQPLSMAWAMNQGKR